MTTPDECCDRRTVPSRDDIQDIYTIRLVPETLVIRHGTPRVSEGTLSSLEKLHESMDDRLEAADWIGRTGIPHDRLRARRRPRLTELIGSLRDASFMHVMTTLHAVHSLGEKASRGHAEILRALAIRDYNAAEQAMSRHVEVAMAGSADNKVI